MFFKAEIAPQTQSPIPSQQRGEQPKTIGDLCKDTEKKLLLIYQAKEPEKFTFKMFYFDFFLQDNEAITQLEVPMEKLVAVQNIVDEISNRITQTMKSFPCDSDELIDAVEELKKTINEELVAALQPTHFVTNLLHD